MTAHRAGGGRMYGCVLKRGRQQTRTCCSGYGVTTVVQRRSTLMALSSDVHVLTGLSCVLELGPAQMLFGHHVCVTPDDAAARRSRISNPLRQHGHKADN